MKFSSYAHVTLCGRLGQDPVLSVTSDDGTPLCTLSVAVDTYKGKDERGKAINETTWYRITCWRALAEHADKWLTKGCSILAEGELQVRSYIDKQGVRRTSVECIARELVKIAEPKNTDRLTSVKPASPADKDPWLDNPYDLTGLV